MKEELGSFHCPRYKSMNKGNTKSREQWLPTHPHVVSNMPSKDVLAVNLSIQRLLVLFEPSKSLVTVGNVKATIQSSLQDQK